MSTMNGQSRHGFSRRTFLANMSAIGAALSVGLARTAAAGPSPDITKIRLVHAPAICFAPQYLAEELLLLEGFAEVEYVQESKSAVAAVAEGRADFSMDATPAYLPAIDKGMPIAVLAGLHAGCYELFGHADVRAVRDMQGKRVAISVFGAIEHILVSSMVAYVGIDPKRIDWVQAGSNPDAMRLFEERKADAFLGFPPQPQELRAKRIGRVILNMTTDKPWSQYFCCSLGGNREFIAKHPDATKRVVRAFLKAADICAQEPERVARFLVTKGYEPRYEIGLEVLKTVPYNRWRYVDPEDTLRFHALRLHEVGMIKTTPQKLIAQGTDWRFLKELKKELKA
jgi:NitT/TauT family transport system substrate-binding protein